MQPGKLTIERTLRPKVPPPAKTLVFGRTFVGTLLHSSKLTGANPLSARHRRIICSRSRGQPTQGGKLRASIPVRACHYRLCHRVSWLTALCAGIDGPLSLEPSSSVLHYAQTLFEGLKAYRDDKGKITLFRPDMNMKRMNASAARIALPVRVKTDDSIAMDSFPIFKY